MLGQANGTRRKKPELAGGHGRILKWFSKGGKSKRVACCVKYMVMKSDKQEIQVILCLVMKAGGLILCIGLFAVRSMADDTSQFERAIAAITNALPPGWTVEERKSNQIPYGHHWQESYTGPKGTLLIVKGTRPVNAEFSDSNSNWKAVHVATEALEIWIMPNNYNNSSWQWLSITRPIQPIVVVHHGPIKVYASQWAVLLSQKDMDDLLSKPSGIRWPDDIDSPDFLTWKDWRSKLHDAIKKEFAK
jgi:hypothetical protein